MDDIEVALGISEASDAQLRTVQEILNRVTVLAVHADHADGSVHPKFVRDALAALTTIGYGYAAPCDLHLYVRDEGKAVRLIQEFCRRVPTRRNLHLASESVTDAAAALRLTERAIEAELNLVPSIQTDPFTPHDLDILRALLSHRRTQAVSILTPRKATAPASAAQTVIDLYHRLVNEFGPLNLYLDRNCSPERVRYIAQQVSVHSVVSGTFIWLSSDPIGAIASLRAAARSE